MYWVPGRSGNHVLSIVVGFENASRVKPGSGAHRSARCAGPVAVGLGAPARPPPPAGVADLAPQALSTSGNASAAAVSAPRKRLRSGRIADSLPPIECPYRLPLPTAPTNRAITQPRHEADVVGPNERQGCP